jgi:hypothetical protein
VCFILHQIRWMMPTSGIVPISCAAATEGAVQLPADSYCPSKLSGAWACRAAQRKVLEHVALGHGNSVAQRNSPPLVGFTSLPVVLLLLQATAAASPPMSMKATSPSPPLGKLSPPLAHRLPRVEAQVVPVIQDRSWQCYLCTYQHNSVPGSRTCIMCHSTRRQLHCAPQHVGKSMLVVRTRGSGKSDCLNCRLAERCKACLLAHRDKCINVMTVQVKNEVLLFWRGKNSSGQTSLFPSHILCKMQNRKKLTRINRGAAGNGLYRHLWAFRVRCQLPLLVDC